MYFDIEGGNIFTNLSLFQSLLYWIMYFDVIDIYQVELEVCFNPYYIGLCILIRKN